MIERNDTNGFKARYEEKFASFIEMCDSVEAGGLVLVATPHALGDTYEELIESLNRLQIGGPSRRKDASDKTDNSH